MYKHLNGSTRPEININKLDFPTPSSINPYVNHVAEQLYNRANPNEYTVFFRVTYTGTLIDQLLSSQFLNQINLAIYEQLKNKLFSYIVVIPDDASLEDNKHIFIKTNSTSNNEILFTNFSDKGDMITLSIKKSGSSFTVGVNISDNSNVISDNLLAKINNLSNRITDVEQNNSVITENQNQISLNKIRIQQLQESINANEIDIESNSSRIDILEDIVEGEQEIDLSNYYTKKQTLDAIDDEVNNLKQEIGNYYLKKPKQEELVADGQLLLINNDGTVVPSTPTISELAFQSDVDNIKNAYIKSVGYNIQTGIFTFTKQDGTIFEVDLAIEKVVANFLYNSETQSLELTLADGTVQSIPLTDFIKAYEGVENDQIQVSVQSGNKIQAILKNGSVTFDKLHNDVANAIQNNSEAITNLQKSIETTDQDIQALDTDKLDKTEAYDTFSTKSAFSVLENRTTALENKFTADLTGSKWTLFNPLPDDTPDFEYNLTFVSNGATFTKIAYNKEQYIGLAYINSSGGVTTAYNASDKIWSETNYQTIEITGGTDVTNLETIGTLKTIGARISGGINVDDNVKAELEALNIRVNGVSARVTSVEGKTDTLETNLSGLQERVTTLENNQGSSGGSGSTGGTVGDASALFTQEEATITTGYWLALSDLSPYTYSASVTLTTSLDNITRVELINNNPVLFATYGFAIGNVTSDGVQIYSIGQPTVSVTLMFELTYNSSYVEDILEGES